MLRSIMLTLLAISATRQACDVGCLKCSVAGDCLIPDILNSYYLNGATATKASLTNCTLVNIDGKCVGCGAGYYLDSATNKCVAVATASLLTNCAAYSNATSCGYCSTGYYFSNNACVAVETAISNCEVYSGLSTCSFCAKGYLLALDSKSCAATPSINNCGDFTFVKCNTCDAGYVLYPNNYLTMALAATSAADRSALSTFASAALDNRSQQIAQSACQTVSTTNCALFDQGINACTQCSSGYFLDTASVTCVVFPDEPIENCLNYNSLTSCAECVAGYYFKATVCTQIAGTDIIANCATYNSKASTVQCSSCSANYYLNNNSCSLRVNSASGKITNCGSNDNSTDKCAACSVGYVLSTDGLACFAAISNCNTYVSTSATQVLRCNACNPTYYLTETDSSGSNSCQSGSVDKCKTYAVNSGTTCSLCLNGFYLNAGACVSHLNIDKCDTYNTSTANLCFTCTNPGYFNFFIEKFCQTLVNLSDFGSCTAFSGDISAPVCTACNTGYYVKNNKCESFDIANCLSLDLNNNCAFCAQGYALSKDAKKCLSPIPFITDNCLVNSTSDASNDESVTEVECSVCKTGAIPFDLTDYFVCVSNTDTQQYVDGDKIVNGCTKYDEDMNCVQCGVNGELPFLDTVAKTCVSTCGTSGVMKYLIQSPTIATFNISQLNVCATTAVVGTLIAGCGVYGPDLSSNTQPAICIKCLDTHLSVLVPAEESYSNVDPSASTLNLFFPSAFAKFPKVTCAAKSTPNLSFAGNATSPTVTSINNCTYYKDETSPVFSCLRCDSGYTGTISGSDMVGECVANSVCTTDKYYNLDAAVNNLTSCYKCNNNNIPFIAIKTIATGDANFNGFKRYAKTLAGGKFSATTGTEKSIVCRENNGNSLGLSGTTLVVENCGMAILNVESDGTYADNAGSSVLGVFCVACKPGYKGTKLKFDPTTNYFVYAKCELIVQCATTSTYFNSCSACNTGFILNYTADNIDYFTCLSIPASTTSIFDNCLAASATPTTSNAKVCEICKTGYFLNADNICEKYQPLNCELDQFTPVQNKSRVTTLDWSLWLNSNAVGCNKCAAGSSAYKLPAEKVTCINSNWVLQSADNFNGTKYIKNCKNYGVNNSGDRFCNSCNTNYVISGVVESGSPVAKGAECFSNAVLNNCVIAKDASTCLQCTNSTFSLRNNVCELGNIANCIAYNFIGNSAAVKCTTCAQDYYLDTAKNICVLGEIYNCKVLTNDNGKGCTTCATGYFKVGSILNNYDYCYPVDTSLGCSSFLVNNDATNNGGRIACNSCTNNSNQLVGVPPAGAAKSICLAHSAIANCKSYLIGNTLNNSNFRCTECNSGYYLNANNRCVIRANQPGKCSLYNVTDDTCLKCDSTSYLSSNQKNCVDYPKGILGCRTYSNATSCSACKEGRYLNANACSKVPTLVANCQYYSSSNSCSSCSSGYTLVNNTCIKATAANCTTYTSENVCSGCPAGYVLQTTSNVTNCVALAKTGCVSIDINTPYNCLICSGNYYLEAGECKNPTAISNCAVYATKLTCARCNKGYALSANSDACTNSLPVASYIDSQCVDSQVVGTAVCSRCSPGFYFVSGACTGSCNNGAVNGCLACDPKKATTCYICKSGYYQTKDGACNEDFPESDSRLFVGLLTALIAVFSLML